MYDPAEIGAGALEAAVDQWLEQGLLAGVAGSCTKPRTSVAKPVSSRRVKVSPT